MGHTAISKAKEVIEYASEHGRQQAIKVYNLSEETFNRYKRAADKEAGVVIPERSQWLEKISSRFSEQELQAIAKGGRLIPGTGEVPIISFGGKHIRIGCITDTHIGHLCCKRSRIEQAFEEFHKSNVDFVTHSGDVTEGMSHRPGQIYELDFLGYDAQKREAIDIFSQWTDTPIYAIDGNHDRWYLKSNGAMVVKDIADAVPNFHFIGHDEGDISLDGRATLKLWHGEDGSSYALSYRLQKIIESLSGGEKPNILVAGHVHKFAHIFERNVHCVSAGCIEAQTSFMRGKRLSAHVGFCILDAWICDTGISKFRVEFFPFYA